MCLQNMCDVCMHTTTMHESTNAFSHQTEFKNTHTSQAQGKCEFQTPHFRGIYECKQYNILNNK